MIVMLQIPLIIGMAVYCICLPHRRMDCEMFFETLGVVPVYTDVTLAAEIAAEPEFVTKEWKATRGALACAMSHRTACQTLLDSDEQCAVVFEDDNDIPDMSKVTKYHRLVAELKERASEFNYINLSPCCARFPPVRSSLKIKSVLDIHLYKVTGLCTNAYIVSRAGAEYILHMKWNNQWDHYLKRIPKTFDVHPRLFKQNSQGSSIGNPASPPEYSYTFFVATTCTTIGILAIVAIIIHLKLPAT